MGDRCRLPVRFFSVKNCQRLRLPKGHPPVKAGSITASERPSRISLLPDSRVHPRDAFAYRLNTYSHSFVTALTCSSSFGSLVTTASGDRIMRNPLDRPVTDYLVNILCSLVVAVICFKLGGSLAEVSGN